MTTELIEIAAVLACTLFTGAAVYVSMVEHPARMSCGTEIAATEFVPSYKRGALMQAPLALVAGFLGILRGVQGAGPIWWWAGILILSAVPFTLLAIRPTNERLLDPRRDRRSDDTRRLLESWGRLHAVRSALSLVASLLFLWAVTR